MELFFDHLVVVVRDLEHAKANYQKLGFTVTPGGRHFKGISENALIFFKDGSFIELLALTKSPKVRLLKWMNKFKWSKRWQYSSRYGLAHKFYSRAIELPEGITDYCLITKDSQKTYQRIQADGIFLTSPLKAGRKKPDGSIVTWEMYTPYIADLPFIRSDFQPQNPLPEAATKHPNGATGISKIHHAALDFKECVKQYGSLLHQSAEEVSASEAHFDLGISKLHVYWASKEPDKQKQVKGKGIGLFAITLAQHDTTSFPWDENLSHGLSLINS